MDFYNNFTKALIVVACFFVTVFLLMLFFDQPVLGKVCFKDDCFRVTLAKTVFEQRQGLMFQDALDADRGMLFVFNKSGKYSFWMKNTKIPLDIIWMDESGKVVFMSQNTQPCTLNNCPSIYPDKDAKYVLEINSGMVESLGLQLGDNVVIKQ